MVARQRFPRLELRDVAATVLATIVIAREQERVRDLATEAARDVDELRQPNDGWPRHCETLRAHDAVVIRLDDLGFTVDHKTKRPTGAGRGRARVLGRKEGRL